MVFKMQSCQLVLVCLIFLVQLSSNYAYYKNSYTVPAPEITVYPKGFRVSIPDEPGIEMVSFRGSINQPIRFIEPGTILMSTKVPTKGKWVLENNNTKAKVGDSIYYWLYVRKNRLTFMRPYERYEIKEILPHNSDTISSLPTRPLSRSEEEIGKSQLSYFKQLRNYQNEFDSILPQQSDVTGTEDLEDWVWN